MNTPRIVDQVRVSRTSRRDAEVALESLDQAADQSSDGELLQALAHQNTELRRALAHHGVAIAALEQALLAAADPQYS